jgi:hypothetical protein
MKSATLFLLAWTAAAGTRVGVLGLFRASELVLRPRLMGRLSAGGEVFVVRPGQALGLRAEAGDVDCFVARRTVGGPLVRLEGLNGGEAEFTLAVKGKIERVYTGVLEVRERLGTLEAVIDMDPRAGGGVGGGRRKPAGRRARGLEGASRGDPLLLCRRSRAARRL